MFTITLEAARVNKNYTQDSFAKAIGVHKTTIYNWEKGITSPSSKHLRKISSISGIPSDYIFLPETLPKVDNGEKQQI